jgi:polyhydroxyalkanoate synthase
VEAAISLSAIRQPLFVVGTEADHVAPWRRCTRSTADRRGNSFVLTSGGHNAGIVSEPGHPHRHFRLLTPRRRRRLAPDEWLERAEAQQGSWWLAWKDWLDARSGEPQAPADGHAGRRYPPLADAPGRYVLEH